MNHIMFFKGAFLRVFLCTTQALLTGWSSKSHAGLLHMKRATIGCLS
ncbi:hypothetical protein BDA96_02G364700 [Sorghum bicolor]|uniref:Uncharacterized protein n=2 Tax=Sorghum bicolor TaxID=4558 RepID=A0A921RSW3_SORBI|nr:hypothetical protein BDA96_02G364700 [Sorghum bicolor]OQU90140.1 hypothetical protein SORBI_3002G347750 [Sorghum bicolor]